MECLGHYTYRIFGIVTRDIGNYRRVRLKFRHETRAFVEEIWEYPAGGGKDTTLLSDRVLGYLPPELEIRRLLWNVLTLIDSREPTYEHVVGTPEELDKAEKLIQDMLALRAEMPEFIR